MLFSRDIKQGMFVNFTEKFDLNYSLDHN